MRLKTVGIIGLFASAFAFGLSGWAPFEAKAASEATYRDSHHAVWDHTPRWIRDLGKCIRHHESINAGHYRADNPKSTASGAYQMINSTWQGNAKWATWRGDRVARTYKTAASAPRWVQDVVFIHSIRNGGIKAWHGTGCPGTE